MYAPHTPNQIPCVNLLGNKADSGLQNMCNLSTHDEAKLIFFLLSKQLQIGVKIALVCITHLIH